MRSVKSVGYIDSSWSHSTGIETVARGCRRGQKIEANDLPRAVLIVIKENFAGSPDYRPLQCDLVRPLLQDKSANGFGDVPRGVVVELANERKVEM